jgi:hypothetical protein
MDKFLNRPQVMITLYVILVVFVVMDSVNRDWLWLGLDIFVGIVLFPRFRRVVLKKGGEDVS